MGARKNIRSGSHSRKLERCSCRTGEIKVYRYPGDRHYYERYEHRKQRCHHHLHGAFEFMGLPTGDIVEDERDQYETEAELKGQNCCQLVYESRGYRDQAEGDHHVAEAALSAPHAAAQIISRDIQQRKCIVCDEKYHHDRLKPGKRVFRDSQVFWNFRRRKIMEKRADGDVQYQVEHAVDEGFFFHRLSYRFGRRDEHRRDPLKKPSNIEICHAFYFI